VCSMVMACWGSFARRTPPYSSYFWNATVFKPILPLIFKGRPTRRILTPVDPKKDQVEETRRVLREIWDKADRALTSRPGDQRVSDLMSAFGG
jgi:hypothetical protein